MEVLISGIDAVGAVASAIAGGLAVGLAMWKVRHTIKTDATEIENEADEGAEA